MDVAKIRKRLKESGGKKPPRDLQEERSEETSKTENLTSAAVQKKTETQQVLQAETTAGHEAQILTGADTFSEKEIEILAFNVAHEEYAVMTAEIQEILKYQKITLVPRSPEYLKGVTSIRGKVLPVVDLKERLGLKTETKGKQKIIILKTSKGPLGALVGSVLDVLRFPETGLLEPPPTLSDDEKNLIAGVVRIKDRFISILNINEIVKTL